MPNLTQTINLKREDTGKSVGASTVLVVGALRQGNVLLVGTVEEEIAIHGDITIPGMLYVRNHDAEHFVDLGWATGDYDHRVEAGEQGCIPLHPSVTSFFVIADTAECQFEYEITQRP